MKSKEFRKEIADTLSIILIFLLYSPTLFFVFSLIAVVLILGTNGLFGCSGVLPKLKTIEWSSESFSTLKVCIVESTLNPLGALVSCIATVPLGITIKPFSVLYQSSPDILYLSLILAS